MAASTLQTQCMYSTGELILVPCRWLKIKHPFLRLLEYQYAFKIHSKFSNSFYVRHNLKSSQCSLWLRGSEREWGIPVNEYNLNFNCYSTCMSVSYRLHWQPPAKLSHSTPFSLQPLAKPHEIQFIGSFIDILLTLKYIYLDFFQTYLIFEFPMQIARTCPGHSFLIGTVTREIIERTFY